MRSFRTRTLSTIVLIGVFFFFLWAGHVPCLFLVLGLQILMVREAFELARRKDAERKLPGFRAQQWLFFFVATFYLYLRFINKNLLVELSTTRLMPKLFAWLLKRHMLICYSLYLAGFVMFVLSLKRGMYVYQFGQYAWTHMIILIVIMPTSFFVSNIFEGMIWYVLPSLLIIVNDITAYLAGFFFGRTPLIKLSPKKTWEGFIGGFVLTVTFSFFAAKFMSQFKWLTCPRRDLSLGRLHCPADPIFRERSWSLMEAAEELPGPLEEVLGLMQAALPRHLAQKISDVRFTAMPVQLHAMMFAIFASVIAPFGGFFASGFKRAFKMKDFGDTIPGHGGITDRFDCQVLMAMYAYIYYWNYVVKEEPMGVGEVLSSAVRLRDAEQLQLFLQLGNLLVQNGVLPGSVSGTLEELNNMTIHA